MTEHKTRFEFHSDALDDGKCQVFAIEGEEGISRPYRFVVDLAVTERPLNELAVLQQPASLTITSDDKMRTIHGVLAEFQHMGPIARGVLHCRAVLVPRFWMLGLSQQTQIFGSAGPLSVIDVLKHELLGDGHQGIGNKAALGLLPTDFEFRLSGDYQAREHIVQYQESDLDFVNRLMEHEGIWYYFEQGEEREKVVFCDANVHSPAFEGQPSLRFQLPFGHRGAGQHAMLRLTRTLRRLPAEVLLSDYNYELPHVRLQAGAPLEGNGARHGVVTRYGDHFKTPEEGARYARLRAEELACEEARFQAESDSPLVGAGFHFDLENHYSEAFNQRYLITSVTHRGRQPVPEVAANGGVSEVDRPDYRNTLGLHASSQPYRPPQVTPRPNVPGIMNAHVDAEGSGERAEIDSQGRYKVVMPFDQRGADAGKASRYMRMSQPYAGRNTGMHFPLLKGTEVLWACVDGNPDRPVICGSVPNPNTKSPVTEADRMKNRIVTTSGITVEMNDGLPRGGGEDDHWPDQPAHVATEQQQGQGLTLPERERCQRSLSAPPIAEKSLPQQRQAEADLTDQKTSETETWYKVTVPNYDGQGNTTYYRLGASDPDDPIDVAAVGSDDAGRYGALLYTSGDYRQQIDGESSTTILGPSYSETKAEDGSYVTSSRTWDTGSGWRTVDINYRNNKTEFSMNDKESFAFAYSFEATVGLKESVFVGAETSLTCGIKTSCDVTYNIGFGYAWDFKHVNDTSHTVAKSSKSVVTDEILLCVDSNQAATNSSEAAALLALGLGISGVVTAATTVSNAFIDTDESAGDALSYTGVGSTAAYSAAALAYALSHKGVLDTADLTLASKPQIKIDGDSIVLKVDKTQITLDKTGISMIADAIVVTGNNSTAVWGGSSSIEVEDKTTKVRNSDLVAENGSITAEIDLIAKANIQASGNVTGANIHA